MVTGLVTVNGDKETCWNAAQTSITF